MADFIYPRNSHRQPLGMRWSRTPTLLAGVGLLAAGVYPLTAQDDAPSHKVTAVRFWSLEDLTRIAIEADSDFEFKATRLTNPERVFFDIPDARPDVAMKGTRTIPVDDGLVKRIRVGQTQKGLTRIVLDLEKAAEFKTSQLKSPSRLIVEMRAKGAPEPVREAAPAVPPPATPSKGTPAPEPEKAVVAKAKFVGPVYTHPQVPRRFMPPPIELLPAPIPEKTERQFPQVAYVVPPPALAMMAKPSRVPTATLPLLPRPPMPAKIPVPARRNSDGTQSLTRVLGLKLGRVVLDPGHGGHDDGTHGASGIAEKDLVLDIALRLGTLLEQRLGSEVVLTRSDDTFVPLEERTHIANMKRADLFLSIHANSSPDRSVAGIETYYLNLTPSKASLETAARENAGSERSIFELKELLSKIALRDKIEESREFASRIQTSLFSLSSKNVKTSHDRGIKRAPFVVLIGADMPSVLAEIGFLTNSTEEALLRKDEYRDRVAEALYQGIAAYAETLSRTVVAKTN